MAQKIAKLCGEALIAFALACLLWYLVLMQIPDDPVLGSGAPTITKEEVLSLMDYHGIKTAYVENRIWRFDRGKNIGIPLKRK